MLSAKFSEKLNQRLALDPTVEDIQVMLDTSSSLRSFSTHDEAANYLSEGALLNINRIASKALSVPCGDYMVWATDAGHTMLVPVAAQQATAEVFEHDTSTYDVFTPELLGQWRGLERTIAEELPPPNSPEPPVGAQSGRPGMGPPANAPNEELDSQEEEEGQQNQFKSRINMATVDRPPLVRAMEQQNHTVSSLAAACGVDPPAISRILRTPRSSGSGDPGGRNPSMGLAAKIAHVLRIDVESAFPDIFDTPKQQLSARDTPGNRGSGMKGHAKGSRKKGAASKKWTQGGKKPSMESISAQIDALLS